MNNKKKVIFCTYSSIYSSIVLEQLIADQDIELVGIVNSTRVLRPSLTPIQGAISQLKISGFRYSTYLFLITDIFKWIQPLFFLKQSLLRQIHSLAKSNNISICDTKDINSNEAIDFIKENQPEIMLCAHFNQLLKAPIFAIEKLKLINIHPSLLPKYKGVDPVFYALNNNANEIGVTLHRMDENFDTGEILSQSSMIVDSKKSLFFNNCQLFKSGVELAISWMKNANSSPIETMENNHQDDPLFDKDYDSWPTRKDVKDFNKSGRRLITISALWNQL